MQQKLKNIIALARFLGIRESELKLNGHYKAKVNLSILERLRPRKNSKYVLVSAITPTPLGEGKTITTIGLSMALNRLKYKSVCTLRQSSLGPLFGTKGAASGGGASRVLPSQEISLHCTGDIHAVGAANNLLVSFVENSFFHGNSLNIDPSSISIKRCLDVNDRFLRHIRYSLKSKGGNSYEMATGFEITAATEVMSILALSLDSKDMHQRLGQMAVARNSQGDIVKAKDLKADGMMAVVLRDAIEPNLVQTSEHTPCFVHTGSFANVSIGTSSVVADQISLSLCDYVVTESGFGFDCGGEKFFDIKCRYSGFKPDICILVCSVRGLKAQSQKFHLTAGKNIDSALFKEDLEALNEGIANLKKQIENVRHFCIPAVVSINIFSTDTQREIEFIQRKSIEFGAQDCLVSSAWQDGSKGILKLAQSVVRLTQKRESNFKFLYDKEAPLRDKIETIAKKIYGAKGVDYSSESIQALEFYTQKGFGHLPVCIAKTQFSISHDETLKGAPTDFILPIKNVRLCSGAGFVLAFTSLIQTMPGLPIKPRGEQVDIDDSGEIIGLS